MKKGNEIEMNRKFIQKIGKTAAKINKDAWTTCKKVFLSLF